METIIMGYMGVILGLHIRMMEKSGNYYVGFRVTLMWTHD